MTIITSSIPQNSLLKQTYHKYDYADSFQVLISGSPHKLNSIEISRIFFLARPKWGRWLFVLRNAMVVPFGIKTSKGKGDRQKIIDSFRGEKSERLGLFKVFDKTEDEIILGENDKHLNFRVSLHLDRSKNSNAETKLTISTIVLFNNWAGGFYFFFVGPFHRLIVPHMLKRMIRQLENKKTKIWRECRDRIPTE